MSNFVAVPLASAASSSGMYMQLAMFAVIIVVFYFILIRPQKKKERAEVQMRKNVQVGDEVVTAGGIVGIVFSIKDDTIVIETGGDRSKIRVKRWAISSNETIREQSAK